MKPTLSDTYIEPIESVTDMQVLVAFEDSAAGNRAMTLLEHVGRECGVTGPLIHMIWRFDELADPGLFKVAVREALAADIILLATREGKDLSPSVRKWIDHWLVIKEDRPFALVATLDHKGVRASGQRRVLPYLEKVARLGKMQFFANGSEWGTEAASGESIGDATGQREIKVEQFLLETFLPKICTRDCH